MRRDELERALATARRVLRGHHEADDLAQETVIRVWRWKGRKLDAAAVAQRVAKQVVERHHRSDDVKKAVREHAVTLAKVMRATTSARSLYQDAGQAADFYAKAEKRALRLVALRLAGYSDIEIGEILAPGKTYRQQHRAVLSAQAILEEEAERWL